MADRKESITEQRLTKLGRIRSRNIDPYPHRYHRTHTIHEATIAFQEREGSQSADLEVSVAGRIVALRSMGKATFLDLKDGSGKIQVYIRRDAVGDENYQYLGDFDIGLGQPLRLSPQEHQACHVVWPTVIQSGQIVPFEWQQLGARLKGGAND